MFNFCTVPLDMDWQKLYKDLTSELSRNSTQCKFREGLIINFDSMTDKSANKTNNTGSVSPPILYFKYIIYRNTVNLKTDRIFNWIFIP